MKARSLALALASALALWALDAAAHADTSARRGPQQSPAALAQEVHRLAPSYNLDPALVAAVILAESRFATDAVSPKNAMGLMQLTPETQLRFGVGDPFDAEQNLRGGMSYLRFLLDRYRGDLVLSLAAYNAGEAAVDQYHGVPPFAETQAYVAEVRKYYAEGEDRMMERLASSRGVVPLIYRGIGIDGRHPDAHGFTIEHTRFGVTIIRGPGSS